MRLTFFINLLASSCANKCMSFGQGTIVPGHAHLWACVCGGCKSVSDVLHREREREGRRERAQACSVPSGVSRRTRPYHSMG